MASSAKPMPSNFNLVDSIDAKCCIPHDCIDPRRLPLFCGRAFFRDLVSKLEACRSGEAQS